MKFLLNFNNKYYDCHIGYCGHNLSLLLCYFNYAVMSDSLCSWVGLTISPRKLISNYYSVKYLNCVLDNIKSVLYNFLKLTVNLSKVKKGAQ